MIKATFKLDLRPLHDLEKKLVKQIIRKAIRKVAKEVKDRIQVPKPRTGYMQKSFGIKVKTYKGTVIAVIGPKSAYRVDLGTISRGPNKGQVRRYAPSHIVHLVERGGKRIAAKPFMLPALPTPERIAQAIRDEMALI